VTTLNYREKRQLRIDYLGEILYNKIRLNKWRLPSKLPLARVIKREVKEVKIFEHTYYLISSISGAITLYSILKRKQVGKKITALLTKLLRLFKKPR
jgi:hypothetical protein